MRDKLSKSAKSFDRIWKSKKPWNLLSAKFQGLRFLHLLMKPLLIRSGYELELKTTRGIVVGLWRNRLRRDAGISTPKRLVIVPGFGDSALSWMSLMKLISRSLVAHFDEVIVFDFPGFQGFLSDQKAFASMDHLLGSVEDLLVDLKPHTLIGHSLGAWISAWVAARDNKKITKQLVLMSPPGLLTQKDRSIWKSKFDLARKGDWDKFSTLILPKAWRNWPWVKKGFLEFFSKKEIQQFIGSIREDHLLHEKARDISANVWLIWGKADKLNPSQWAELWVKELARQTVQRSISQTFLFENVGHLLHLEQPIGLAWVLRGILRESKHQSLSKGPRLMNKVLEGVWGVEVLNNGSLF